MSAKAVAQYQLLLEAINPDIICHKIYEGLILIKGCEFGAAKYVMIRRPLSTDWTRDDR